MPRPAAADPRFDRRLALVAGRPAAEARTALRGLADDARDSPAFDLMANLCRTLADPHRLLIAAILKRQDPLSGTEIQAALDLTQPTVSHHLRILTESGLVSAERAGKWTYYRLEPRLARLVP